MSYISQIFRCLYRTGCKKNHHRNQNKYFSHFFFAPKKECAISKFIRQIYTHFPHYITAQLKISIPTYQSVSEVRTSDFMTIRRIVK